MAIPNGGLINETNAQYYAGTQQRIITATGVNNTILSTFDTLLSVGAGNYSDPGTNGFNLNNFKIFTSPNGNAWTELIPASTDFDATATPASAAGQNTVNITANANILGGGIFSLVNKTTNFIYGTITAINAANTLLTLDKPLPAVVGIPNNTALSVRRIQPWTMVNNLVTVSQSLIAGTYLKIQMNESTLDNMHGSYEYTRLNDIIDNFLIAYVGVGKLIPSIKRSDVIFHAKRGLQEFSYDTLKSIKSQELQVPSSLSLIIPQDYVNYVKLSWVDKLGVLHTIYPTNNLNQSPYETLAQDDLGHPIQDSNFINTETTSEMNAAWSGNNPRFISGGFRNEMDESANVLDRTYYDGALGQRYGLEPQTSQKNGWFKIDEAKGTFNFTSNLSKKVILLEYISDGNAYDLDARIPKMAEEALYSHIIYSILSVTRGIQEYIVLRFKKERSAKLRNAKIRLSNIKLDQIIQVMRGKAKWIK